MRQSYRAHDQSFTRAEALELIWRHTSADLKKTKPDGTRLIGVYRSQADGNEMLELEQLTDADVADKLPNAIMVEARESERAKQREQRRGGRSA